MILKKNWTYKLLTKLLYININNSKNNNIKNLNFDIKLYLIGLSFNRFIFNLDKIVFMLCIITNFLLFLNWNKNNILFIGDPNHKFFIKKYANLCNQHYYEKILLPGSFSKIEPISDYYKIRGKNEVLKEIDCIICLSLNSHTQFFQEVFKAYIPIISLISEPTTFLSKITYPIFINKNIKYIYFFSRYFSKILNIKTTYVKQSPWKSI